MSAKQRYDKLTSDRSQFLDVAKEASRLTLPYLVRGEDETKRKPLDFAIPSKSLNSSG